MAMKEFLKTHGLRALFPLLFFCGCLLALPTTSSAHAFPVRSVPQVGSTVRGPIRSVRIWFDSDLEPLFSKITVKNASGKQVDKKDSHVAPNNDELLIVDVPPLSPGKYHVYWSVVARDTHHTEGDFIFTVK